MNKGSRLRPFMMPTAILCGILFHQLIAQIAWLVPYFIFTMLLLTFNKVEPRSLRFTKSMWILATIQLLGAPLVYIALLHFDVNLALSLMLCVLCPVATAAPVVTGLLGGNVGRVAAFSILSNCGVALLAPLYFSWFGQQGDANGLNFFQECIHIAGKVAPMIVVPIAIAFLLRRFMPTAQKVIAKASPLSFYLWVCSLIIVVGRSVNFIIAEPATYRPMMFAMAFGAAVLCILQFFIGKRIGRLDDDVISSGQSLGQKNTILAIWMALTYLDGVASVAPAAYVIWQNLFNSWQMYRHIKLANSK